MKIVIINGSARSRCDYICHNEDAIAELRQLGDSL